jgi:hypothetical protein
MAGMEADELAEVDQQLRGICARHGLDWVVSQVDGLVSQGRDVFTGHESSFQGRRGYSDLYPLYTSSGRPTSAASRSVAFSPTNRTLLLIDAMLTVFTQLPSMQANAIQTLREGYEGRASVVGSIAFGDDGPNPEVTTVSDGSDLNYQVTVTLLQRLREEVVAE